ncbi:hypothetical protein E0Z10_g8580 [Xylaria hypoxylon]|uniref:Histone deacetylase domain-containing protein n=1 Tax=Xylaria hypoxylon TaxID=37992 RepID=A0A4Z0YL84_9PEZI|nr:hypothetical protein E0Z10_g8580 [Xylaria hypoxylon]
MTSPERSQAQPILASVNNTSDNDNNNNNNNNHDHDLLHSLKQLSLSTSPQSNSNAPSNPTNERRRSSISPSTRPPSRSPLTKANVNGIAIDAQFSSPSLIRKASMNSLYSANGGTPNRTTSRRGSSTPFLSPTTGKSPNNLLPSYGEAVEERPPRTAASVASVYFAKELEYLHSIESDQSAETIVILHDDCYGHRYSRPRASKSLLSTIVERPERIQASILGVSMAYVRLGERHCEGKNPIHLDSDPKTSPSIPFLIHKTTRKVAISSAAVTNVHGNKWMEELKIMCDSAEAKLALNGNELRRPEMNRGPDAEPPQHFHQGDLYLCPESLNAFEGALGAVCEAVDTVFSTSPHKRAFIAVRPPGHHCSSSFPSGFCWVNNVHVGIMHGILNHGLTHAAIIDFDLHHGDGSQAIAWQHNKRGLTKNAAAWKKTSIGYFSVHDINSYPCEYGDEEKVKNASLCIDNAHGQNIWNVHLQEWKSDLEFWRLYQSKYSVLLEKTRNYLRLQTERFRAAGQVPKAAIFLSAGFDASEWEGAGMQRHKVNVPTEFYARLTRDVVRVASEEGLSVDGRVISVLEGGYSDRALYSGVLSHMSGLAGIESITPKEDGSYGLVQEMADRIGPFSRRSTLNESDLKSLKFPYDPNWWSIAELDRFDADRISPPPEPKRPRAMTPGNYSSPTQSSNAKMTEVAKIRIRRSLSNLPASQIIMPRSPTPPPPDIAWTTAAHELSKLLIPNNRQVDSCTHSELNTEATKPKRDRQSLQIAATNASNPPAAPTRMSLRERKPVSYLEDDDYQSRRKTVAGPAVLATSKASVRGVPTQTETKQPRQASRRLSAASSLSTAADVQMPSSATARLDSSLSMRPNSSMSIQTQTSAVVNSRKGRPAAPPRKDSSRAPRAPRKTKLATAKTQTVSSAATTEALTNTNDGNSPLLPKSETIVATAGNSSPATATSADLDQITNGMKKIKINVLTKEQKAARLKAKAEMSTANDILTSEGENSLNQQPSSPPTLTEARFNPTASDIGIIQQPTLPIGIQEHDRATPTKSKVETTVPTTPTIISPTEPSLSSTPFKSSPLVQSPPKPTQDMDLFVPYQPDGPPPNALPIQRPVQILEPNTGTPARPNPIQHPRLHTYSVPVSPARRGGHGFSATSSIPFSPGPVLNTQSMFKDDVPVLPRPTTKTENIDSDEWEMPEIPEHQH